MLFRSLKIKHFKEIKKVIEGEDITLINSINNPLSQTDKKILILNLQSNYIPYDQLEQTITSILGDKVRVYDLSKALTEYPFNLNDKLSYVISNYIRKSTNKDINPAKTISNYLKDFIEKYELYKEEELDQDVFRVF